MLRSVGNTVICPYWHKQLRLHLHLWVLLGQTALSTRNGCTQVTREAYCFEWNLGEYLLFCNGQTDSVSKWA